MRRLLLASLLLASTFTASGLAAVDAASAATVSFPTVSGHFGTLPTVKFSGAPAPKSLETKVLSSGNGATVKKGQLIVVNYLGQIWNGKVFDSSFSRSETFATPIGLSQVVKGWDQGLVGQKIGSRVELVIPPALGYGTTGNTGAGIKGTDDLVFVVDLIATYGSTTGAKESAKVVTSSSGGVSVKNVVSTSPTVTVAKNTKKPTAENVVLLARGTGSKVVPGMLVFQYVVADWTGKTVSSTWQIGTPSSGYAGASEAGPFDKLLGDPIGSRVLVEFPATSQGGGPYAVEIQIAAEVPAKTAKA